MVVVVVVWWGGGGGALCSWLPLRRRPCSQAFNGPATTPNDRWYTVGTLLCTMPSQYFLQPHSNSCI